MATTTTNFGWDIPQSTDLVKDGATAIATLGQDIDTSLVDLKGGTTGQVLKKASNTDMDFTWSNETGDIEGVTAGTGLTGGGTSGTVTLDFDVANYGGGQYSAGKNKIINGDFGIWQRGTSFTTSGYSADRWYWDCDGTTKTAAQQTFTPGTAPVLGYESTYFIRGTKVAGTYGLFYQAVEDVRSLAGQTVTLSFYAKASTTITVDTFYSQNFGSGGSANVSATVGNPALTTSWQRFSYTFTVPSISGKTVGTSSFLSIQPIRYVNAGNFTIDLWGVQLEAGSTATPFQTATGTKQGELAACQRYYFRFFDATYLQPVGSGNYWSTTQCAGIVNLPVTMRTRPTLGISAVTDGLIYVAGSQRASTGFVLNQTGTNCVEVFVTTAADTAGRGASVFMNNNKYLDFSAEL